MSDYSLSAFFGDRPTHTSYSRGGARPNSGPKPGHQRASVDTPDEELTDYQKLERAKAEKEFHLARQAKVKADIEEGRVVARDQVVSEAAKAFAAISQSLDAIPDALERDGIDADVAAKVGEFINAAKLELMRDLEKTYRIAIENEVRDDD